LDWIGLDILQNNFILLVYGFLMQVVRVEDAVDIVAKLGRT
jgi:hypothetical protein